MCIKVSIIVPVYNIEPYLSKCMDSLCNQTLKDIEIIVINDNSTDNCKKILESYAQNDFRVKIINNPKNLKTAETRNAGLAIAKGEYVAFVDGDDYIDLDFYEKLYSLAKENNADIAKGATKIINEDNSVNIILDDISKYNKYNFWGYLWSAIYRQNILEKNNIKFYIDFFCFQVQAVYFANKIVCCNDVFYNYIRHANSCDSEIFTLEKWQRLNLGHGNFIYDWILSHKYEEKVITFYLKKVKSLYFYGFNKLAKNDVILGCEILAETMREKYNCGYDTSNIKNLCRKLYRKNKKITLIDYCKYLIKYSRK